jgi:hypothetical protein
MWLPVVDSRYGSGNLTDARTFPMVTPHGRGGSDMPPDQDNPSRWWALAAEARAVSAEMTDPQARQIMLKIAEGYERLARRAEVRRQGSN